MVCPKLLGQTISLPMAPLNIDLRHINKTDSLGAKSGYWCESSNDMIWLCFYEDGEKNGLAQCFRKLSNGQYFLQSFGYYQHNKPAYQWQFFYNNGMIATLQTKISKNYEFLNEAEKAGFYNPQSTSQCYIINYNTSGKITSEGWCIFQNDVEEDAQEVGIWKYFTPNGMCSKNKSLEY